MTTAEAATCKQKNAGEPTLRPSSSKRSLTADQDFYSLSNHSANNNNLHDEKPLIYPEFEHLQQYSLPSPIYSPFDDPSSSPSSLFTTPPSRFQSPTHVPIVQKKVDNSSVPLQPPLDSGTSSEFDRRLRRKLVSSVSSESSCTSPSTADVQFIPSPTRPEAARRLSPLKASMDNPHHPATPAGDDMPYIRFAIDQLTRDEEVRGSRLYPDPLSEPSLSRASLAEQRHGPFAATSPTGVPLAAVIPEVESSDDGWVDDRVLDRAGPFQRHEPMRNPPIPQTPKRTSLPAERVVVPANRPPRISQDKEMSAGIPPRHPLQESPPAAIPGPAGSAAPATRHTPASSVSRFDLFVPFDPSTPSLDCPALTFLPTVLRPLWLGLYIFICVLMLIGLIFCAAWSKSHDGLWAYKSFGDSRYFTFEYLPTMLGMVLLLWLIQIEVALQRIAPFLAMAANSTISRSQAAFLDLYPTQYLYPKTQYFRARQWIIGICFIVFWLFLFTIPLLSASFNARWTGDFATGHWRWLAAQGVIWTVITLYILLIITLILLAIYLNRGPTGLKWDPRSIADIVALLERANIMADYANSERFVTKRQFRRRLQARTDRLGYWHTSRRPRDIFYGLGEEGGETRRYSLDQGRIREKPTFAPTFHSSTSNLTDPTHDPDIESVNNTHHELRNHSMLRRHTPWPLTSSALLAFMLVAIVLLITFLVASFVRRASTAGFFPKLGAAADVNGFSPANFLYSFIPALLGLLLFLVWQPLDFSLRRLAPFSALSHPDGASASHSLLLDYPALGPFICTLRAILNRDFLVAFSSFITIIASTIPVLAGGVFWAQWYAENSAVKVSAEPAGWYALCFFLAVYAFAFVALFVRGLLSRGRGLVPALPHAATCLAELLSWLYMSPLLTDAAFCRAPSKRILVARLTAADPESRDDSDAMDEKRRAPAMPESAYPSRPPRLNVRLLDDDASASASEDGHHAPHNAFPHRFAASPRLGSSHEAGSKHATTRPLSPLTRPLGPTRFAFGIYLGRDGREHLGIDRVVRSGREMVVLEDVTRTGSWMFR